MFAHSDAPASDVRLRERSKVRRQYGFRDYSEMKSSVSCINGRARHVPLRDREEKYRRNR